MRRGKHGIDRDEWRANAHLYAPHGSQLPQTRLTPDDVRAIRRNWPGWSSKRWARHLGVHYRTIQKIQYYETWRHVKEAA